MSAKPGCTRKKMSSDGEKMSASGAASSQRLYRA